MADEKFTDEQLLKKAMEILRHENPEFFVPDKHDKHPTTKCEQHGFVVARQPSKTERYKNWLTIRVDGEFQAFNALFNSEHDKNPKLCSEDYFREDGCDWRPDFMALPKERKTAEELKVRLDERIARYHLGHVANAQFIKIVPADPNEVGANWKVSRSGAPGDLADAIDRVTPELQKLYELKE